MSDSIYVVKDKDGRPRLNLSSTSEGVAVRNKNEATAYSNPLNKHTIHQYIPAPQWVPVYILQEFIYNIDSSLDSERIANEIFNRFMVCEK